MNPFSSVQELFACGQVELVYDFLCQRQLDSSTCLISIPVSRGHYKVVEILLTDERLGPSHNFSKALRIACFCGDLNIVKLLLSDSRSDPSAQRSYPFRVCCKKGFTEIAKLLLQYPSTDPLACNGYSLKSAIRGGHVEIVKLLLQDQRIDPSVRENTSIRLASSTGNLEIFNMLLSDPRIDPSLCALNCPNPEIMKILLSQPRVQQFQTKLKDDPHFWRQRWKHGFAKWQYTSESPIQRSLLQFASESGYHKTTEFLLSVTELNEYHINELFCRACHYGYFSTVKVFLDFKSDLLKPDWFVDERGPLHYTGELGIPIKPTPLIIATRSHKNQIAKLLSLDPRVKSQHGCLLTAIQGGNEEMVKFLLPSIDLDNFESDQSLSSQDILKYASDFSQSILLLSSWKAGVNRASEAIYSFILSDPRLSPTNHTLTQAATHYSGDCRSRVEYLFQHPRAQIEDQTFNTYYLAAGRLTSSDRLMRYFLSKPELDPSYKENSILHVLDKHALEVLELILGDQRFDPSRGDFAEALVEFPDYMCYRYIQPLLSNPKISLKSNEKAWRVAFMGDKRGMMEGLLKHPDSDPSFLFEDMGKKDYHYFLQRFPTLLVHPKVNPWVWFIPLLSLPRELWKLIAFFAFQVELKK